MVAALAAVLWMTTAMALQAPPSRPAPRGRRGGARSAAPAAAPAPAWNAYEVGAFRALRSSPTFKAATSAFSATGYVPMNAALSLVFAAPLDWSRPWRPRPTEDRSRASLLYGVALVVWAARRAPYATRACFTATALRLAVGPGLVVGLGPAVAVFADARRSAATEAAARSFFDAATVGGKALVGRIEAAVFRFGARIEAMKLGGVVEGALILCLFMIFRKLSMTIDKFDD